MKRRKAKTKKDETDKETKDEDEKDEDNEVDDYEVEAVVGHKTTKSGKQYKVKFKGFDDLEFIPESDMAGCQELVDAYNKQREEKLKQKELEKETKKRNQRPRLPKQQRRRRMRLTKIAR